MKKADEFDSNHPETRLQVAAILAAGYAPYVLKKKPKNIHINEIVDLFWDFADVLKGGRKQHEQKK